MQEWYLVGKGVLFREVSSVQSVLIEREFHCILYIHFFTFCELVEGEENKLTAFSTWTIVLGCNESNINFQQHLCKLGQLRRSNGRNSQVFGLEIYGRHTFVLFVS